MNEVISNGMKKILPIILLVVAVGILISLGGFKSGGETNKFEPISTDKLDTNNLITVAPTITLLKPQLTLPNLGGVLVDRAWDVFQSYLKSAQEHDLEGLRLVSYQISEACNDPQREQECFSRMDGAYYIGSQIKREDLVNVWSDSKQIILASDYTTIEEDTTKSRGLARSVIYFTIDDSGNIKVLNFNNLEGAFIIRRDFSDEQLDEYLLNATKDSDEDGIPDRAEICDESTSLQTNCVQTDPNKRDTDGNGWWDGIQRFFYN